MEQIKKYLQYVLFAIFIVAIGFGVYYAIRLLWIDSAHKEAMNEYKKLAETFTAKDFNANPIARITIRNYCLNTQRWQRDILTLADG